MPELLKLMWAYIRCNFWLLFHMHNGYCMYTKEGGCFTTLIAASSGSIIDGTIKVVKVFYEK